MSFDVLEGISKSRNQRFNSHAKTMGMYPNTD